MAEYKITTDVFTLPYEGDNLILYAPLKNVVCVVNPDTCELLANLDGIDVKTLNSEQVSTLDFFREKGVINGDFGSFGKTTEGTYEPTRVTLFPTNQCNLRCSYCYASAGDLTPLVMPIQTARAAVDLVAKNAKSKGLKTLDVGFHGGGEPLFPWKLIQEITTYVEKRAAEEGLAPHMYSATNAVLSEKQLKWIVGHFKNLNISFDGLPDIQDRHRPLPDGKGSFACVDRTMRFLDENNFTYGIRGTVSEINIDRMEETVDFIGQNYRTKSVHLEPLFYCGRCKTTSAQSPDLDRFCENFIKCEDRAAQYGIRLIYSGASLEKITNCFCGVSKDSFNVTPDGYITTCYEISSKTDPKAETFFYGHFNGTAFEIDPTKRAFLNSLHLKHYPYCKDCFAKYHCGGECVAKLENSDLHGDRGHDRCQLNRELIARRLRRVVEGHYKVLRKQHTERRTDHDSKSE